MQYNEVIDFSNYSNEILYNFLGLNDVNLKLLKELYKCDISYRNNELMVISDDKLLIDNLKRNIALLMDMSKTQELKSYDFYRTFEIIKDNHDNLFKIANEDLLLYTFNGKPIKNKSINQYKLSKAILENDIVFSIGPAGTGKTFLSVTHAIKALKSNSIKKIILTRPAVEAGESLGFLPGDLKDKINPYLLPLYDIMDEILGVEKTKKLLERNIVEIIPLAYMRGRTLNDAFIILDEAQNTSNGQMLMFLTRLGYNSKMVINGDPSQVDLNLSKTCSGLIEAQKHLKDIDNIKFIYFSKLDVVRHHLVSKIIEAYNR